MYKSSVEQQKASPSSHDRQGKIFRKSQDDMIDQDWMKFQILNLRKEDSFQIEPDITNMQGMNDDTTKKASSLALKLIGDQSNKISYFINQNEESQSKNMLNPDDIQIQTPHNIDTNNYKSYEKLSVSQQQIPLTSLSAGLSRRQVQKMTQHNKPSLNLISTSVADMANNDHHNNNNNNNNNNNASLNFLAQNKNLNLIMNIKKRITYFNNYYTYFGRQFFLQNEQVRKTINDQSDFGKDKTDSKPFCLTFHKILSSIRRHKYFRLLKRFQFEPFSPHTTFYIIWKFYVTFYNYLFFIVLSFLIIFEAGLNNQQVEEIYFNITAFQWCLEILVKTNTAIYIKTKFINKRQEICKVYLQKQFFFDIVPLILILIPQAQSASISYIGIRILLFLKYVNSYRDSEEAQKQLLMRLRHFYFVQLINLIINLFLVGHVIACVWYIMSLIERHIFESEESWFSQQPTLDGTWWKTYLSSYYWSFTLMATGSNEATTLLEIFFTCIIMIFTTIIFGYMVNTIGVILSEMNKLEEEQRRDINLINTYMKRKCISKKLQLKINLDLEQYYLRSTKNKSDEENQVLAKISSDLNDEIKLEYYKNILQKVPFLIENFQKETIDKLCLSIEEVFYSPNQIIFNEQEFNDFSLIVIVSVDLLKSLQTQSNQVKKASDGGEEETVKEEEKEDQQDNTEQIERKIINNNDGYKIINTLKKGSTFGEINFFTEVPRDCTAKSRTFTTVLKIERNKFLQIIQNNQKDFEKFCEMKDKIQLYNNYKIINKSCKFCLSNYHLEYACNQAHFDKNSPFFFSKINVKQLQERQYQNRRSTKSYNSYLIRSTAQNCIDTLKQQYDLSEENKKKILDAELPVQFSNLTIDYENEEEDDDYLEDRQNFDDKTSQLNSPKLQREESITNGYYQINQNNMQSSPLYVIPEENNRQKTVELTSEISSFKNANSLVYINNGSSGNNIDSGFSNFQKKQSMRFQSNNFLGSSTNSNNGANNLLMPIKEDQTPKETNQQQKLYDNFEESQKQVYSSRDNYYNSQLRENLEHKKTMIQGNSPRTTRKVKSIVQKNPTILQHNDQSNQSINNNYKDMNQQRRFNILHMQTGQQAQIVQNLIQMEKSLKQMDRSGERKNSYLRNDIYNEKIIPLEEKNKNDFLFLFDSLRLFNNYFIEGNANIMINKWTHQRKKYLKKYASGEAKALAQRNNRSAPSYKVKSQNNNNSPVQLNQRSFQSPLTAKK